MRHALALVVLAAMTWAVAQAFGDTMNTTPVAYIGCSNSSLAVDGYHMDGGTRMWPATKAYNGGTVLSWTKPGTRYWPAFDHLNATYPGATQLWFQPCVRSGESPTNSILAACQIVATAKLEIPGVTVYVSALSEYASGYGVRSDVATSEAIRDDLVLSGVALAGPRMPLMTGSLLRSDRVHPNEAGSLRLGKTLLAFLRRRPPTRPSKSGRRCRSTMSTLTTHLVGGP
jgi:hypothetical protein